MHQSQQEPTTLPPSTPHTANVQAVTTQVTAQLPPSKLFTVLQAMEWSQLSHSTLYNAMASGALKSLKIGRSRRIRESDLAAWIDSFDTTVEVAG